MRILSFNLRTSYASGDGANHWDRRKGYAAETIRDINPDLCGLQEMDGGMWKDLEPALGDWNVVRAWVQSGKYENGNGLLIRKGAFEVLETGQFWLSSTPERESISLRHDWGPRGVLWARVKAQGGDSFTIAVTHFDTHQQFAVPAATIALEQLGRVSPGVPTFLVGDFNATAGGGAWKRFTEAGFKDAWVESGQGEGPEIHTFNGFTGKDEPPGRRIDWILHRGPWKAISGAIDRRHKNAAYPSDHFPVHSDFRLESS